MGLSKKMFLDSPNFKLHAEGTKYFLISHFLARKRAEKCEILRNLCLRQGYNFKGLSKIYFLDSP
jgi:hypothetical protein